MTAVVPRRQSSAHAAYSNKRYGLETATSALVGYADRCGHYRRRCWPMQVDELWIADHNFCTAGFSQTWSNVAFET